MHEGDMLNNDLADTTPPPAVAATYQPEADRPAPLPTRADIARYLTASVRWIIQMEQLPVDPLPSIKLGRNVRYDWRAVEAWALRRQRQARPIEEPKLGRPAKARSGK